MYYIHKINNNTIVDFEVGEMSGRCNITERTIENLSLPDGEEYDGDTDAYVEALQYIVDFAKPIMGEEETDNYICMLAQPSIKITTDIKLNKEVEPDA